LADHYDQTEMRGRIVAPLIIGVIVLCTAVTAALATPSGFSLAATRTCLMHQGAVFGSAVDPAVTALPAADRRRVLAGVLPPGTTNLILVAGNNSTDAVALRNHLAAKLEFKPTASNSRSAQVGNAAWFVESLGGRPSVAVMGAVRACLKTGPASPPGPITLSALSGCFGAHGAYVLSRRDRNMLFPAIPAKLDPYLLIANVPGDNSGSSQGIFGFVLVGKTLRQSLALRAELVTALSGRLAGHTSGQTRGTAWLTIPTGRASTTQINAARRVFNDCLA
jgi:hypothetical protein